MYRPLIDYDYNLESSVLGACIAEPAAFGSCYNLLNSECFYGLNHQQTYIALLDRFRNGYPIDLLTVSRYFFDKQQMKFDDGVNVSQFLTELMFGVFSSAHLETWCRMLRELAAQRLMMELKNTAGKGGDVFEEAREIEEKLKRILDVKVVNDWKHISDVGKKAAEEMAAKDGSKVSGITTSLSMLDNLNNGFQRKDFVILGARPAVGKSAFMGRLATHAAAAGHKVGIISLEMGSVPIYNRLLSAESDVDHYKIDRNRLSDEIERGMVYEKLATLSKLPIYFSDTADVNITDIRAKAEKLRREHGVDVLLIDYLQLVEPEADKKSNREQEVSKISRGCKKMAMSMDITVIALAQLNRQIADKKEGKPELHHLRESGSLEQDADVVMFLYRPFLSGIEKDENGESTEGKAELLVRKWRNGISAEIPMGFDGAKMKFTDPLGETKYTQFPTDKKTQQKPDNPRAGFQDRRDQLPKETGDVPF